MPHSSIPDVLQATRDILSFGRLAFENFLRAGMAHDATAETAELCNAVVWGRATTNILQNIRTFDESGFNEWYRPIQEELAANLDFRYLYELRSQILKEGLVGQRTGGTWTEYISPDGFEFTKDLPPFAYIETPGRKPTEPYDAIDYLGTTDDARRISFPEFFEDATSQSGIVPPKTPIHQVLQTYLTYLESVVSAAEIRFNGSG